MRQPETLFFFWRPQRIAHRASRQPPSIADAAVRLRTLLAFFDDADDGVLAYDAMLVDARFTHSLQDAASVIL